MSTAQQVGGASGQGQQETTWFGGGSEAGAENWGFVREGEQYLEAGYKKIVSGEELPLIQLLAALSLAFGVANMREVTLASVMFLPPWYFNGDGFDGMISTLSGIQLYKKKYRTMAFPALLESYKLMRDFTSKKYVTKNGLIRVATFLVGYFAARYKYV